MSRTWTVTSTFQKLPVDDHNSSTNSGPTTITSTVQSAPFSSSPAQYAVTTGRTSVSRLRSSFEAMIQQSQGENQRASLRRSVDFPTLPSIPARPTKDPVPPIAVEPMDNNHQRPSLDILDEHSVDASPGQEHSRAFSPSILRLKTPIWSDHGGRSASSTPQSLPRRSKRSLAASLKSIKSKTLKKPDGTVDEDVSPTNSGTATPRVVSPEDTVPGPQQMGSVLELSTENVSAATQGQSSIVDEPMAHTDAGVLSNNTVDDSQRPPQPGDGPLSEPTDDDARTPGTKDAPTRRRLVKKDTPSRKQSEVEDLGVPTTCAIFSSPFRRGSSVSPVRQKVSIFEGLIKPSASDAGDHPQTQIKRRNPDSLTFLTGTDLLDKDTKSKSAGWLPKSLRKLSVHRSKDRKTSDDPLEATAAGDAELHAEMDGNTSTPHNPPPIEGAPDVPLARS